VNRVSAGCTAAIVLAIVGVFGTWRSASPVSLDGVEGPQNGWLVIVFGLIALAGVRAVLSLADDTLGGSSGWGVWLTLVASAGLAALALAAAVERLRGSTRTGPRTSP